MLNHVRHTDQLPALSPGLSAVADTPIRRLTPADFSDTPYHPTLLLSLQVDQAITSHKEYQNACKWGYDFYFEGMYEEDEQGNDVFAEHIYTEPEVATLVMREMQGDFPLAVPLAIRVGVVLGMLSALALTDLPLAQLGRQMLLHLVQFELMCSSSPVQGPRRACETWA